MSNKIRFVSLSNKIRFVSMSNKIQFVSLSNKIRFGPTGVTGFFQLIKIRQRFDFRAEGEEIYRIRIAINQPLAGELRR